MSTKRAKKHKELVRVERKLKYYVRQKDLYALAIKRMKVKRVRKRYSVWRNSWYKYHSLNIVKSMVEYFWFERFGEMICIYEYKEN